MFSGNSNYLVPELGEMGAESCRFSECRKAAAEKEGREKDAAQDAPVRVLVGVAIIGISELDIITQEFKAEFQLDQTWHDPEFCGWMKENRDKFAQDWQKQMFERAWHPNLFMVNQVEIISREGWWNVSEDDHITLKLRMKGIFSERFELRNFPFDVQNLRLEFQSSWSNDLVQFVDTLGDREASNILNKRRFILEEWALGEQVLIKTMTSDKEESRQGATYGRFQVYVYVARQWKFYCWNIFSILFLITSLSHFVGVVDESEFTDRLPNLFTMLLVSVAFKLAIANQLPAISYQTMIDNCAITQPAQPIQPCPHSNRHLLRLSI